MIDTTGEGWAFHLESMIVPSLTVKKRWTKLEVIQRQRRLPVTKPSPARRS
jgi:hypothetical protein